MVRQSRPRNAPIPDDAISNFPPQGAPRPVRRLGVFLFWDSTGSVKEYVKTSLLAFAPFFEKLVIVVNGEADRSGQDFLAEIGDEVWYRENVGHDAEGYKYAIERIGYEVVAEFDELIIFNSTFYAPLRRVDDMFERMWSSGVDFWGVTDFRDSKQNFVQSYFIAAKSTILRHDAFRQYWQSMPSILSMSDAIEFFEKRFTQHFSERGFSWDVAFPVQEGEFGNVTIASPIEQISDGCPTLKYRAFTFPLESLRHREAPYPARTLDHIRRHTDYDAGMIVDHLVRTMPPSRFAANLQTLSVAGTFPVAGAAPLGAVGVFLNVPNLEALKRIRADLDALTLRGSVAIFLRTSSSAVEEAAVRMLAHDDVTVRKGDAVSNVTALFGWTDEVDFGRFDLVLSIGDFSGGRRVNAWLDSRAAFYLDNLVADENVLNAVAQLFQDSAVDMVMSPASPYLEGVEDVFWGKNQIEARRMAKALGVADSVVDEPSNLHAPHGLFWMRGRAASDLAAVFAATNEGEAADHGELFNRFLPALLAARGKVAWRLVSADNAAQALAALGWIVPQFTAAEADKRREIERSIAALQLEREDLQLRLKGTTAKLSQANAALAKATAEKQDLEVRMEPGRLAVAENRDLRRLYNKAVEDLAELRRNARNSSPRGPLKRAGGGVKRAWKRMLKRARSRPKDAN